MAVSQSDVLRIAALARLRVPNDQLPTLVDQLNGILAHMDVLTQVDTITVAPTEGGGEHGMPLRDDVVAPIPMRSTAEALTAESHDSFIIVPRLSTHGDL